jgi:glycosyltransferase involved in cell wall biosynthesis
MKIAINARFSGDGFREGYGRFTEGLIRKLAENEADQFVMMYDRDPGASVIRGSNIEVKVKGPAARHPLLWKLWYDISMPSMARSSGADLIFSPDGFCSLSTRIPQVLAIHDLAFHHFPQGISSFYRSYYTYFTPRFIRKARHIVTVSEFSKADILRHYPFAAGKISVVHNAADELFKPMDWKEREEFKAELSNGAEYFLYAGAIHPRKNVVNLLKGFSWFKKRHKSNMKMVLAGRLAWGSDEFTGLLKTYKYRDDVIHTGYVSDERMAKLMASSYALVYPSYWEGFGLPVVEAMQAGVPVLTSSNSAMPEIAGEAALYCEPADHEGWGKLMGLIYKDENLRSSLVMKGLERSAQFSWDESAAKLRTILEGAGK